MNIKKLFYLSKINIAKLVTVSCIFLFAFLGINSVKVNAADITIVSSTYTGNGNNNAPVEKNGTVYIQGKGISHEDGITFKMTNIYTSIDDITAIAVWESAFSSSSINPDYDRWYIRTHQCGVNACNDFETIYADNEDIMRYPLGHANENKIISTKVNNVMYYIERESALDIVDAPSTYIKTDVDFTKYFTANEITYTYRIRNANYINRADKDGFGYKEIFINYWKATSSDDATKPDDSQSIEFGLAKVISDVNAYTNYNYSHSSSNPIACSNLQEYICIDYVDTNGDPTKSTTVPKATNINIPSNVIYDHKSTTNTQVISNYRNGAPDMREISDSGYVKKNNTTYALNYFCESPLNGIVHPTLTYTNNKHTGTVCESGSTLREYLYVEAALIGDDINDVDISDEDYNELLAKTHFLDNPYKVSLVVDARGSYVVFIRDAFGNTNELAVIKVTDIINQALLVLFDKSNKTNETIDEKDGWKANEYLTNGNVNVTLTMTATTVIEQGLPIIAAETTALNSDYVKYVHYWRVDPTAVDIEEDVCAYGQKLNCADKPESAFVKLYENNGTITKDTDSFVSFTDNQLTVALPSNGRYRFYIETFPGNKTSANEGETKNPRVEIYKIDKGAPSIYFGGSDDSYCTGLNCSYVERTYEYYQGSGRTSGSIVDNLNTDAGYTIAYTKNGIYYVNANPSTEEGVVKDPILLSASATSDALFTYLYALFDSGAYLQENLKYYTGATAEYAHFVAKNRTETEYKHSTVANYIKSLDETEYRTYIIANNIMYTAYALGSNGDITFKDGQATYQQNRIKIEYLDKVISNTSVCDRLPAGYQNTDFNNDGKVDQEDCANYYLDHSLDFIIKITVYDVVQDSEGNYILGNANTREITVDVQDTTAPGYNKQVLRYNLETDCRIELGNALGVSGQDVDSLFGCYGIYTDSSYNFEDNTFDGYTQNQTINTRSYVDMYVLSKETKRWVNLKTDSYIPNRSGKYAILTIIRDAASVNTIFDFSGKEYHDVTVASNEKITVTGNAIANLTTYYVDKKIVVIQPESNEKVYGADDPVFTYSVWINTSTSGVADFLKAPFADMDLFTKVGNATVDNGVASLTVDALKQLFQGNYGKVDFSGSLTRQESGVYNDKFGDNVTNDYVGLYKIVLGTLNIEGTDNGYDLGQDYIVKIDPRVRNGEYQLVTIAGGRRDNSVNKCNLVDTQIYDSEPVSGCYGYEEDDDFFVESIETLKIKQTILTVVANGSEKVYGSPDPNYGKYAMNTGSGNSMVGTNGYLEGFTVSGLVNDDAASIVLGVLRREIGENVGTYAICNYRGTSLGDKELEGSNINMLVVGANNGTSTTNCATLEGKEPVTLNTGLYNEYGIIVGGTTEQEINDYNDYIASRALYVTTNKKVAGSKTLNVTTDARDNNYANYVIGYSESILTIKPATIIVQPTPGQRREYSYSGVDEVDPWEILVFGEKEGVIAKAATGFNGYTVNAAMPSAQPNDPQSQDKGTPGSGAEYYNNASEDRAEWKLVRDGVTYTNGKKVNETYSLFVGRLALVGYTATDGKYANMPAGWYSFAELEDSTLVVATNSRTQCSYSNYKTTVGSALTGECRNYDLILDLDYRNDEGYKNGDSVDGETITVVYESKMGYCKTTALGDVSDVAIQCSVDQASKILFEVYRREIILEFNSLLENNPFDSSEDFVYGYNYTYYKDEVFAINADNSDEVESAKLFYCYASYKGGLVGISGSCDSNKWYGLTEGDSWYRVGLSFRLANDLNGYDEKAIPAGRYYVYASITDTNYKFNYLGGTLTIKTKAVGVSINSYTKEYGNVYFDNVTCLNDGSILNVDSGLIVLEGCTNTNNEDTNTYGFVINGLIAGDAIADNFIGRPQRESNLVITNGNYNDKNGLQEDVGIYVINVGSVKSKNNNTFKACVGNFTSTAPDCVVVSGVNINNYAISSDEIEELTYYLLKNGTEDNNKDYSSAAVDTIVNDENMTLQTGTLTITPATITIEVTPNQTKMYGCAYNSLNTVSSYAYSYSTGYDCISETGTDYDLGYAYTVIGDKDYHIYNYGYYSENYSATTTYSPQGIGKVNNGSVNNSLLVEGSSNTGLRSSGLNGGVLYRVAFGSMSAGGKISYSSIVEAADTAQDLSGYQGQSTGKYVITLGNLDSALTANNSQSNVCDANNQPSPSGVNRCKNYIVVYEGNKSIDSEHTYSIDDDADTTFVITSRVAFVYTEYNSKVYGNDEPVETKTCDGAMLAAGFCNNVGATITYGISYYYTKYNSLAKYPWVSSIEIDGMIVHETESGVNDVQTDVIDMANSSLKRYGMNNGDSQVDDIVGLYNYKYDNITKTSYSRYNYELNFYYRTLDDGVIRIVNGAIDDNTNSVIQDDFGAYKQSQAVNADGGNTVTVDGEEKEVVFEIALRKITVSVVDFAKVYGIEDNDSFFELAICATGDQEADYDEQGNAKCKYVDGKTSTEHGLSASHKNSYVNSSDGTLKQDEFKSAFGVYFLRALGENTSGPLDESQVVDVSLTGKFTNDATTYTISLGNTSGKYQVLGVIPQTSDEQLGYNYEITYEIGYMSIYARTIKITPDANQGFQYGSYTTGSLIPAITYTTALSAYNYRSNDMKVISYDTAGKVVVVYRNEDTEETTIETSAEGLISNGTETKVCLANIDGTNTFCIDDRKDVYKIDDTEESISSYTANTVGLAANADPTYVFGDIYSNELSDRSALDRVYSGIEGSQRYNRNVGDYEITLGDLEDQSGNYRIEFTTGVRYKVTSANLTITPDESQNKIYGEADKELTFTVVTKYTVNSGQYILYNESISSIKDKDGNDVTFANNVTRIKVEKGSEITLNGYAYYENDITNTYNNYGLIKGSTKAATASAVAQDVSVLGKSYDKYCYDNYSDNSQVGIGAIEGCSEAVIYLASTQKVLIGYLYVNAYNQYAGNHVIQNGMVVANNEFGKKNYNLSMTANISFEIKQLDIKLNLDSVSKVYGQSTDKYKCDEGVTCDSGYATLSAQDNEGRLEYNFDISYNTGDIIAEGTYDSEVMVLMVNHINGNYYTQSGGKEDKNNFLGVHVIRQKGTCSINTDKFGCEDAGTYSLVLRKFAVDGGYDTNYNLMYDGSDATYSEVNNTYVVVNVSNNNVIDTAKVNVFDSISAILTISKRSVDIFVNTNLNTTVNNHYQIEQNIEAPTLPVANNSYNLIGYNYNPNKVYHGIGDDASSTSDSANLDSTYGQIVWGGQPTQVRTGDILVGEIGYCNEPSNGTQYPTVYPGKNDTCSNLSNIVYNSDKSSVNTNTKDRFIVMSRDPSSDRGLKIRPNNSNENNNNYEEKNYTVSFYPGAINVVGDNSAPTLVVGNKDYYIEANAFFDTVSNSVIGSYSSLDTILEFLFNGGETTAYVLATVDNDGNLYVTVSNTKIVISQAALQTRYGIDKEGYPGIVSGVEQNGVYPFISDYAHTSDPNNTSYVNNRNITSLESLISTLVTWFEVSSYDSGQYINNEYLERKFDKYYYFAINKHGYNIANNIDNTFAINKVGTYDISFYVMDNSGKVSADGNVGRLHIIDTTAPSGGVLNLYNAKVLCDSECNVEDKWYINYGQIKLASFNRYSTTDDVNFYLDGAGEYIYFAELGHDTNPYVEISDLREDGLITTVNNVEYITIASGMKYSAKGILHYAWSSESAVYLTIVGAQDNSYTDINESSKSQWQPYYSLDNGYYWINYNFKQNMEAKTALTTDGTRTVKSIVMDYANNKVETGTNYTISYKTCYEGCEEILVPNKVNIGGTITEFYDSQVKNSYFYADNLGSNKCVINAANTLVTCTAEIDGEPVVRKYPLLGNKVVVEGYTYLLLGDYIYSISLEAQRTLYHDYITINDVDYRYDASAMMLYRDYRASLTEREGKLYINVNGTEYEVDENNQLIHNGSVAATIVDYSFSLAGVTYHYIDTPLESYYGATVGYRVYQDTFTIGGTTHNISSFGAGNTYTVNGSDVLLLTTYKSYTDTYRLYDSKLIGLVSDSYQNPDEEKLLYRESIVTQVGWNKSKVDDGYQDDDRTAVDSSEGKTNTSLSTYLGYDSTYKYYDHSKLASLDTLAPTIGLRATNSSNQTVKYGEDWYVYEYGYNNVIEIVNNRYYLRGVTYTVDLNNKKVTTDLGPTYDIAETGSSDTDKTYVFKINYTSYYINSEGNKVSWLNAYVEKYAGAKDTPKNVASTETEYYNINSSIIIGGIDEESLNISRTIQTATNVAESSGIGGAHIPIGNSNRLFDFVYMGTYGNGIYYEDIDYIVWYKDDEGTTHEFNLREEFKSCYEANGKITSDCAQIAISSVVKPPESNEDVTYTINYIVRDKAGNASVFAARGILFAKIQPNTNVVVNQIQQGANNTPVAVSQIDENTYSLKANQGVSLDLLNQAFNVNYSSYFKSYNKAAVMTIYKGDEVVAANVRGVSFTDYIDSSEIADYTIIYNMNSVYTTPLGQRVDLAGEEVVLHVSIEAPVLEQENTIIKIEDIVTNETSGVLYSLIFGFLALISACVIVLLARKRR